MVDHLKWWRSLLAGEKVSIHEEDPQPGYFKMRDRRGLNANLAPIKRPWRACAIFRDEKGILRAEFAGSEVPVDILWPWCVKNPISYEDYRFWHSRGKFPNEIERDQK